MTQQQVITVIGAALAADTGAGGVYTLTTGRIYETQGPDNAALPLVVFQNVTDTVSATFAADAQDFELQVDCYDIRSRGMAVARTLAARVGTVLHRKKLTGTGVAECNVLQIGDGIPSVEEDANRVMLRFRVYAC